jgi:hypothetical protein
VEAMDALYGFMFKEHLAGEMQQVRGFLLYSVESRAKANEEKKS